jgi:hypothetical protein
MEIPDQIMRLRAGCILLLLFAPTGAVAGPLMCSFFTGVPPILDPASTSAQVGDGLLDCTGGTPGAPSPVTFDASLNVPVITPGAWTMSVDGTNTSYSGILRPGTNNDIEFQNVPFSPPGASDLALRISHIFVNPSATPGAVCMGGICSISETVSDSALIPISNPQGVVAYIITAPVPEPGGLTLFSIGAGVITALGLRKRGQRLPRIAAKDHFRKKLTSGVAI